MSRRHPDGRRHIRSAREKGAQEKISLNSVRGGRCDGKPDKPPSKKNQRVLFRKKNGFSCCSGRKVQYATIITIFRERNLCPILNLNII
jgi:hypothetical protein